MSVLQRLFGLFYNTMQYSQTRDCSKRLNGWNGENFYCSAIQVEVIFRESKISAHVLWLKIESMISNILFCEIHSTLKSPALYRSRSHDAV